MPSSIAAVLLAIIMLLPAIPAAEVDYTIDLLAPNGGEELSGGNTYSVEFETSVAGGNIHFYYSTDGGLSYPISIDDVANTGGLQTYDWFVPNNVNSTSVRLKMIWGDERPLFGIDVSDGDFTILPSVNLAFTSYPATAVHGRYSLLKWNLYDHDHKVGSLELKARYRTDGTWGPWTVPEGIDADMPPDQGGIWWMPDYYEDAYCQLQLRALTAAGGSEIDATTSDEIHVESPWIHLKSPNGGEVLVSGNNCTIRWATANDPGGTIIGVSLKYSTDSGSSWSGIDTTEDDGAYDWTVPSMDSSLVRVRVTALYGEWQDLASDDSDADFRIIPNYDVVTIQLLTPDPDWPGNVVLRGGEETIIMWATTPVFSESFSQVRISLSTDNGATYDQILTSTPNYWVAYWTVPMVDTYEARIKVDLELTNAEVRTAASINPFYIFTTIAYNRPPVAMASSGLVAAENTLVTLDGSMSYDPDGDPISYSWEQTDTSDFEVNLSTTNPARPTFKVNILDYPVTLMFRLTVSDGGTLPDHYLDNTAIATVQIAPSPPTVDSFTPTGGWEGTTVGIRGTNLMGALVSIGGVPTATVSMAPSPANPSPDTWFNFTLLPGVPTKPSPITVSNNAGNDSSDEEFEVHPRPWYCLDHGFNWWNPANPSEEWLSYPWWVGNQGNYRDTFGDAVYINIWVCIGAPVWTPWTGWYCLGYEISQPIGPDPLAAAWYGLAYCHIARNGECFGCSAVSLELYRGDVHAFDLQAGAYNIDDLLFQGELKRRVEYLHGSQVSAECVRYWVEQHLGNLLPSVYGFSGMGAVLADIEAAVASGELGIISMVEGTHGHAVVPYEVVEVDGAHTRIYVYDINRPEFSTLSNATKQLDDSNPDLAHPPYIEIDRSGLYWQWSFIMADGSQWGGPMGLAFVPADVVLGPRTLPTSLEGLDALVFGSATCSLEDEEGNRLAVLENGTYLMEIENATPLWFYGGDDPGSSYSAYHLPSGNYTTHIQGASAGTYNWTAITGACASYAIENAGCTSGTNDTLVLSQPDGNPYTGMLSFQTSDGQKGYDATMVKKFGTNETRERVYRILNCTLYGDSEALINTTGDYDSLVFTNNGPHSITFDVEFQGNVLSQEAWDQVNGTLTGLPSAKRQGLTIGPYQTMEIYPTSWLDLPHASVRVEGEVEPSAPLNLTAVPGDAQVELSWSAPASDGGAAISGYNVHWGTSSGSQPNTISLGDVHSYRHVGLTNGATYYYKVSAVNIVGEGASSSLVGPRTPSPTITAPSAPLDLQVTASEGRIALTWQAPSDDGGVAVTNYTVYRGSASGEEAFLVRIGNLLAYVDSSVSPGETYFYRVAAQNLVGEGPRSDGASATAPPSDDGGEDGTDNTMLILGIVGVAAIAALVGIVIVRQRKN